ncbi:MAG: hypothetical protein N3G22_03425 [Candidatus Micrarchaeota archaeon]|nr:hypothetical protein [Candidatus Micrarchaeota archaeon]
MDTTTIAAIACAVLAFLVYLMWRSATTPEWHHFAKSERKKWKK